MHKNINWRTVGETSSRRLPVMTLIFRWRSTESDGRPLLRRLSPLRPRHPPPPPRCLLSAGSTWSSHLPAPSPWWHNGYGESRPQVWGWCFSPQHFCWNKNSITPQIWLNVMFLFLLLFLFYVFSAVCPTGIVPLFPTVPCGTVDTTVWRLH